MTTALQVTLAIAELIRELGSVPSCHLYARLMDRMSLESYNTIIGALKGAKLVEEKNFLLTWKGPSL